MEAKEAIDLKELSLRASSKKRTVHGPTQRLKNIHAANTRRECELYSRSSNRNYQGMIVFVLLSVCF